MRDGKSASFWGLNGSASLKGKILTVTIVNADATLPREAQIVLRGANVRDATAQVLSGADILAHNTFDYSQVSAPASSNVDYSGSLLRFIFPAASVTRLTVRVG
jgi:alpha-N-arabinofuranosidase